MGIKRDQEKLFDPLFPEFLQNFPCPGRGVAHNEFDRTLRQDGLEFGHEFFCVSDDGRFAPDLFRRERVIIKATKRRMGLGIARMFGSLNILLRNILISLRSDAPPIFSRITALLFMLPRSFFGRL